MQLGRSRRQCGAGSFAIVQNSFSPLLAHLAPYMRRRSAIGLRLGGELVFFERPSSSCVANKEAFQLASARKCCSWSDRGHPLPPSPPPPKISLFLQMVHKSLTLVLHKSPCICGFIFFYDIDGQPSALRLVHLESLHAWRCAQAATIPPVAVVMRLCSPLRAEHPRLLCFLDVLVSVCGAITSKFG